MRGSAGGNKAMVLWEFVSHLPGDYCVNNIRWGMCHFQEEVTAACASIRPGDPGLLRQWCGLDWESWLTLWLENENSFNQALSPCCWGKTTGSCTICRTVQTSIVVVPGTEYIIETELLEELLDQGIVLIVCNRSFRQYIDRNQEWKQYRLRIYDKEREPMKMESRWVYS